MLNCGEIECKNAIQKVKGKMPYKYNINIYRGCMHNCKYCFAMYTHKYLESCNFFNEIFVKKNIVEHIEKELASKKWRKDVICIGGVTDSYQPLEKELKLMSQILKLFIKYKNPVIISTKSDLILRDYDLIDELSRLTYVNIAATITTINESVRRKIEPGAASSIKRFEMLKQIGKTSAYTGLHVMLIIPFITDSFQNIDLLFRNAKVANVDYVLTGAMYLRGKTRTVFFEFVKKEYPELYTDLLELYKSGGLNKEYKGKLYKMVSELKIKYNLTSNYLKFDNRNFENTIDENRQISFFD